MTEVEDFKSATARLLGKLPRMDAVQKVENGAWPRLEIDAGAKRFLAFAADAELLRFLGLPQAREGEEPTGRWREYAIDADGNLLDEGVRHRIRRMDWEQGRVGGLIRSWPEFAKARKVKSSS